MKIHHILIYIFVAYGWYQTLFNRIELPYAPEKMVIEMEKKIVPFKEVLGKPKSVEKRYNSGDAFLSYDFENQNNISMLEIRDIFLQTGWKPRMTQYRDGEYEIYCDGYIKAGYGKYEELIQVTIFYSETTDCFKDEYKKHLKKAQK